MAPKIGPVTANLRWPPETENALRSLLGDRASRWAQLSMVCGFLLDKNLGLSDHLKSAWKSHHLRRQKVRVESHGGFRAKNRLCTRLRAASKIGSATRRAGRANIQFESRAPSNLLALAEGRHGVAVIPSVVLTHRYDLRIARLMHERKPLREALNVVWDRRRGQPRYAHGFARMLAMHIRTLLRSSH